MDEELTLHELQRFEAERKLRSFPAQLLETAWVREAQVEAVIDAVLMIALGPDTAAHAHARHVGEWCARIAAGLQYGPDPLLARRAGVLRDLDPAALERIVELRHLAAYVREYQSYAIEGAEDPRPMSLIVAIAERFDSRIAPDERGLSPSPNAVLRSMLANADERSLPIVRALTNACNLTREAVSPDTKAYCGGAK